MVTLSVIIPTFNGTAYLAEAVKSAVAQTYEPLEIIVIDDGSLEDIESILKPFYPKITYVRQENAGPAAARNYGVLLAKGDVIAFLDDDDVWHPTKTAEQVKILNEHPACAVVYSYPELIDESGNVIPNEAPSRFPCGNVYLDFLKQNRITTPSVTLIRREVFASIGLFDDNREYLCSEDYDLWLRIARKYEFEYCPGALVSYRVRSAGISKNLDNALKGKRYLFDKLINYHRVDPALTDRDFYKALDFNLHNTFRSFAYRFYYALGDRTSARHLMLDALRKNPYSFKDLMYLIIFSLPDSLFRILKKTKDMVSATT